MPSPSFSLEVDSLLSFSLKADSPVELQNQLRFLQEFGSVLVARNNDLLSFQQGMKEVDSSLGKLAKRRDHLREGVIRKREECINAKEENLDNLVNDLQRVNDSFMRVQQELTESRVVRQVIAQKVVRLQERLSNMAKEYLEGKEEFMQLAAGKQNADD